MAERKSTEKRPDSRPSAWPSPMMPAERGFTLRPLVDWLKRKRPHAR